jgi:hypothetical protein
MKNILKNNHNHTPIQSLKYSYSWTSLKKRHLCAMGLALLNKFINF